MSMFICVACDQYADSDDGCVEAPGNYANKQRSGLVCEGCISNGVLDDDGMEPDGRDMSYEGIYRTLTAAGCPDDIAHELAREKSQ